MDTFNLENLLCNNEPSLSIYKLYSVNMNIRLDHPVKQKQCMKPLGIHHCLHQLAVLLLRLDPQLSGSIGGLLFPIIVWAHPFCFGIPPL